MAKNPISPELLKATNNFMAEQSHFYKCIDFDGSGLDARAILWMNEMPSKLKDLLNQAKKER